MSTQNNVSAIDNLNANIEKQKEKLDQLKRQNLAKERREQKNLRAIDTRRKIIIGGLALKYFPELAEFTPQHNNADNNIEFAPLAHFLGLLAGDKALVARLKAEAQALANTNAQAQNTQPNQPQQ